MLSSAGHSHCWTQWLNDPPINLSIKDSRVELQSTLPANHFTQFAFLSNCRAIAWYRDAQPGLGKYTVSFHRLPKELELWLSITRSLERTQRLKHWKIRRCAVYNSSRKTSNRNPLGVKRPALVKTAIPSTFIIPNDDNEQTATSSKRICLEVRLFLTRLY